MKKAGKSVIVLTTASADARLLVAFSCALEQLQQRGWWVGWLVVDGLKAHDKCPDGLENAALELHWLSPATRLNQMDALFFGLKALTAMPGFRQQPLIVMDPDMAANVADIPRFVEAFRQGDELVFAWRQQRQGVSALRRGLTYLYNRMAGTVLHIPLHDINAPMFLLSPYVLDRLVADGGYQFDVRCRLIHQLRDKLSEVPIQIRKAPASVSAYSSIGLLKVGVARLYELLHFIWMSRVTRRRKDIP